MPVQALCDAATDKSAGLPARFSLPDLSAQLLADHEVANAAPALRTLQTYLTAKEFTHVSRSLFRQAFLIQLVTPAANTTLYATRWSERLAVGDPRRSSVSECLEVLATASELIRASCSRPSSLAVLKTLVDTTKVTFEIPIDYVERYIPHVHAASNLRLLPDDLITALVKRRSLLLDPSLNQEHAVFSAAFEKIKVKAYLTDRVLTGINKTNREWRWETHPSSVHFAFREDCMRIEHELLRELCTLDDLPTSLATQLEAAGLRKTPNEPTRCPVTQDPLSYVELAKEMLDPHHGKSSFHVGHLNPLKAVNDDPESGHTAKNISWISEDGNRIQGYHSLKSVRKILRRIARNYRAMGRPLD